MPRGRSSTRSSSSSTPKKEEKSKSPAKSSPESKSKSESPSKKATTPSSSSTRSSGRNRKSLDYSALQKGGGKAEKAGKRSKSPDKKPSKAVHKLSEVDLLEDEFAAEDQVPDEIQGIEDFIKKTESPKSPKKSADKSPTKRKASTSPVRKPEPKRVKEGAKESSTSPNKILTFKLETPDEPEKKKQEPDNAGNIRCGKCGGCTRKSCGECSHCKVGNKVNCIDLYCMNTEAGQKERENAKKMYLLSLSKSRMEKGEIDFERKANLTIQDQVDLIMAQLGAAQKDRKAANNKNSSTNQSAIVRKSPKKSPVTSSSPKVATLQSTDENDDDRQKTPKNKITGVYGGSSNALKVRRCGECEGCMRDDCGQCAACADKPRFGGKGTKKKACIARFCRMRQNQENYAAQQVLVSSDPDPSLGLRLGQQIKVIVTPESAE